MLHKIRVGDDGFDAGNGQRGRRIQFDDARVRNGAAQHFRVKHPRHPHIPHVLNPPGNLVRPIHVLDFGIANVFWILDFGFWRLAFPIRNSLIRRFADSPFCRQFDRVHNLLVAGAAAEVGGDGAADFVAGGVGVGAQQGFGSEDHSGRAVAALHRAAFQERLLQVAEAAVGGVDAFDGGDGASGNLRRRRAARFRQFAVHQHRTRAARARIAAALRPRQAERRAQQIDQQHLTIYIREHYRFTVKCERKFHNAPPLENALNGSNGFNGKISVEFR